MQNIYKRLSVAITDSFIRNDIIPAKKKRYTNMDLRF